MSDMKSSTNFVATDNETLAISFPLVNWELFLRKHSELREKFLDYLLLKYHQMETRLTSQLLSLNSEERYRSVITDSPKLNWSLSKKELGEYIGVAPETISRLLSNLSSNTLQPTKLQLNRLRITEN